MRHVISRVRLKKVELAFDYPLVGGVVLLTLFGLLMIYDASSFISFRDFHGNKYHYIIEQSIWMGLGFIGMFLASRFNYKRLFNLSLPLLLFAIVLLAIVFMPGFGVKVLGAHRWINLGVFVLQPAEVVKLILAIYLSAWFSKKEKGNFTAFILLMTVVLGLVMLEPDMGTAIIIMSEAFMLYFLSGGKLSYFVMITPVIGLLGFILVLIQPYRRDRLMTFLNPDEHALTKSYHIKQILIGLGSGGATGVGIGNSLQKFGYLPENTTDSIFAIIAEEIGFLGAVLLIALLLFVIWRGFIIANRTKDPFGKLLAGGITAFLGMQMLINLGSMTALFPLTGVPLPFISYGGSALVVDLVSVGILLNIGRER